MTKPIRNPGIVVLSKVIVISCKDENESTPQKLKTQKLFYIFNTITKHRCWPYYINNASIALISLSM